MINTYKYSTYLDNNILFSTMGMRQKKKIKSKINNISRWTNLLLLINK